MWNRLEKAAVPLGLAAFFALALYQIDLPGLHYDEAREAGLPALQILLGQPVDAFRGAGVWLGGRLIPLMVADYIGATNVVLALPFLAVGRALGGDGLVTALRCLPVTLSALALYLLYRLGTMLYNRRVALLAFLLLTFNPSFIFWSRQGVFVTSTIIPISLGAALCLATWRQRGSRLHLWAGMFLLGLGLYTKFLFLWAVLAFALVFALLGIVCRRRAEVGKSGATVAASGAEAGADGAEAGNYGPEKGGSGAGGRGRRPYHRVGGVEVLSGIVAFLLGVMPLMLYNWQTGGTLGTIGRNLATSYYGVDNLAFLQNLSTRLGQVWSVLSGNHLWYLGGVMENPLWPYAALVALGATGLVVLLWARDEWHYAALPWLIWCVIVVASCFTVSALWPTHYALLVPWPPLALAVGVDLVWRRAPGNLPPRRSARAWPPVPQRWGGYVAILVVLAVCLLDLRADIGYHRALATSGGLASHSPAIYDLAAALDSRDLTAPVAMDWGFAAQVQFLTEGRVRPIEIFGYEWREDEGFARRLQSFLGNPDSVFIFHAPGETIFPRREAFEGIVRQSGRVSATEMVIRQRDGRAMFTLVRVASKADGL